MNILVYEDNPTGLRIFQEVLGGIVFVKNVNVAKSLDELLAILEQGKTDSLFLFFSKVELLDRRLCMQFIDYCVYKKIAVYTNLELETELDETFRHARIVSFDRSLSLPEMIASIKRFLGVTDFSGDKLHLKKSDLSQSDISLLEGLLNGYSDEVLTSITGVRPSRLKTNLAELMEYFGVDTREALIKQYQLLLDFHKRL